VFFLPSNAYAVTAKSTPPPTPMKNCITCGIAFLPARSWQKYCTLKCRHHNPTKSLITKKYQQSRRELINKIKLEFGCVKCGYNLHAAALDFNHVRGDKAFNVSQDPKVALHKLLAEIQKCEVLCANCHRIHTYENRHWQTNRGDRDADTLA
jgi:hypothetical protein